MKKSGTSYYFILHGGIATDEPTTASFYQLEICLLLFIYFFVYSFIIQSSFHFLSFLNLSFYLSVYLSLSLYFSLFFFFSFFLFLLLYPLLSISLSLSSSPFLSFFLSFSPSLPFFCFLFLFLPFFFSLSQPSPTTPTSPPSLRSTHSLMVFFLALSIIFQCTLPQPMPSVDPLAVLLSKCTTWMTRHGTVWTHALEIMRLPHSLTSLLRW